METINRSLKKVAEALNLLNNDVQLRKFIDLSKPNGGTVLNAILLLQEVVDILSNSKSECST